MTLSNVNKSIVLISRMLDDKKPTKPFYTSRPEKPPIKTVSDYGIERCAPEECGIESDKIAHFLTTLKNSSDLNMHSVIIGRNGKICAEATFNNQRLDLLKQTFSQCKSILSLAVGIAIKKGFLNLDTKIIDIFPEDCNPIIRIKLKDLTVKHLLTMTSGVLFNEIECMTETNWVRSFLRSMTSGAPGKKFNYNSLNSYILSAAICKLSGTSLSNFIETNLFAPLEITDFYWEKCPLGYEKGGWGLYLSPYALFKIANLILNDGFYNGAEIIDSKYLKAACSKQIETPGNCGDFDYGYHLWVGPGEETVLFNGMFGQNVLCFKNSKIVIVTNAGNNEMFQQNTYYNTALKTFGGDFPENLTPSPIKTFKLKKTIKDVAKPIKVKGVLKNVIKNYYDKKSAKALNGVSLLTRQENCVGLFPVILQAVQNNYSSGLNEIAFKYHDKRLYIIYKEKGTQYTVPVGFKKPETSIQTFFNEPYLINAAARFFTDENLKQGLVIDINFLETPCTKRIKIIFDNQFCILSQSETPGKPFVDLTVNSFKFSLLQIPILSSLLEKFDEDITTYKLQRLFSPQLILKNKNSLE